MISQSINKSLLDVAKSKSFPETRWLRGAN